MIDFNSVIDLSDIEPSDWKNYFGPGYRNVCYMTDHDRNGQIILFGFDTEGNRKTFKIPHMSHMYYRVRYKTAWPLDMYGSFLEKKSFRNSYERKKYLDNASGLSIVEALRPEFEFLHEAFDDVVLDSNFNKQALRIFYLDIETEISDIFEKPANARNRINMITIFDTETQKFYTWSLWDAECIDDGKHELYCFNDNEIKMMDSFLDFWEKNYPDVVCGYNSQAYDMPYIVRRIENIMGENDAKRLSPIGHYRIREVNHDNERANVQAEIEVDINGIFSADEMVLYRDKFMVAAALDGGYSLNNVGEHEGLGKKVSYDGTLKDLYMKDYQKFYEYNVRDVDLLKNIEEKCKLIPLARRVAGSGLTNYNAIYSSISYLIGSLISFAKTQMNVIFQSYLGEKRQQETYEGAFVFEPIAGLYKGGIATIDFNSLYPSTIRSLNLSPETYIGKIGLNGVSNIDPPIDMNDESIEQFYFKPAGGTKISIIKRDDLLKMIKQKCIFTRNNTLFLKHSVKQGVVSAWCKHFYALRKTTKKEMFKNEMSIYNKEVPEDKIPEVETLVQNLDNVQHAVKIMLNSVYGILGTAYSPIGNVDIAQTITRNGKFCNQSAAKFIKDWMKEKFHIDDDYVTPVSGDTDSTSFSTVIHLRKK